jgi:MFS transporter, PPP family, 3-phenylpropionic acid transporter
MTQAQDRSASPETEARNKMLLPKVFYFFYYAAGAALFPFVGLYYREIGLSSQEIGWLFALKPFTSLFSASLWGGVADATRRHRQLLLIAILGGIGAALTLSVTTLWIALIPVVITFAFFMAPIIPLVDNSVLETLGENRNRYGRIRLWGALGWGITALVIGQLTESFGLSYSFYGYAILMSGCFVIATQLPISPVHIGQSFKVGLKQLVANKQGLLFLVTLLISGIGLSTAHSFLFLYMKDLGASQSLMGMALAIATVSELFVFFYSGRLLDRWGTRRVLIASLIAHIIRLIGYSAVRSPEWVLLIQLLHGPTFSLIWVAGVSYANQMAPKGMGATAQGLLSAIYFGVGATGGGLFGGYLYEHLGPFHMYFWAGIWVFGGLVLFVLFGKRTTDQRSN